MKLIRHLTPAGPAQAALQPDGTARAVEGDLLGRWRVTDRAVTPGKLLAPVIPSAIHSSIRPQGYAATAWRR